MWLQVGVCCELKHEDASLSLRSREEVWKFLQLPANKLGERRGEEGRGGGGRERGILRNHPRGITGVCCALSQWARTTGDLLTAADQSGSERPGAVTPAAGSENKTCGFRREQAESSVPLTDAPHGLSASPGLF